MFSSIRLEVETPVEAIKRGWKESETICETLRFFRRVFLKILSYMVLPCPDPHFHPFNYDIIFLNFLFLDIFNINHIFQSLRIRSYFLDVFL